MERTSLSVRYVSVVSIARRLGAAGAVEQHRRLRQPRWLAANEGQPRRSLPLEGSPTVSLEGSPMVSVVVWRVRSGVPYATLTNLHFWWINFPKRQQSAVDGCGLLQKASVEGGSQGD